MKSFNKDIIILTEEKNIFAFGNKEYGQRGINPKEEIQIVLKRYLEKIVLLTYRK